MKNEETNREVIERANDVAWKDYTATTKHRPDPDEAFDAGFNYGYQAGQEAAAATNLQPSEK